MGAVISECGKYRYLLDRKFSGVGGTMLFIMLNPSTADAELDDPTIRKCIGFAKREGYGSIKVVNLFAWRATQVSDMKAADAPIGVENDRYIKSEAICADTVVCAWGIHGNYKNRAERVLKMLSDADVPLSCLGTTKDKHPKHPCYLSYTAKLEPYGIAR